MQALQGAELPRQAVGQFDAGLRAQAQGGVVGMQAFGQAEPGPQGRIRLPGQLRIQLVDDGPGGFELALAREQAGAFGAQAFGLDRIRRRGDGCIELGQQARASGGHVRR